MGHRADNISMDYSPEEQGGSVAPQPGSSPKKPYEKPACRHERVFETAALNCGKIGTQGQCNQNRKNS